MKRNQDRDLEEIKIEETKYQAGFPFFFTENLNMIQANTTVAANVRIVWRDNGYTAVSVT